MRVEYGATAEELAALYREYDWWADRDVATVRDALAQTDEVVVLRSENKPAGSAGDDDSSVSEGDDDSSRPDDQTTAVAAARVVTDYTYYAMVYDVIVRADRRGEGIGQQLMAAVREHPRLDGVDPMLLAREGLVDFYESCGFEPVGPVERPNGPAEPLAVLVDRHARGE